MLWDVDHTLVENAGVSKETYAAAFLALAGVPIRQPASTDGRTDRVIMRSLFEAHRLTMPDWPDVYDALQRAGEERFRAMQERGSVLPGVRTALATLANMPGVAQSLLTGNIAPNARMKVAASGIDRFFDFDIGGYGADSDDRSDLVAIAQRRASQRHHYVFHKANTLLIGDTPRDIEAANLGGAQVLAVDSGSYSEAQLRASGDAVVVGDLRDTSLVIAAVKTLSRKDADDSPGRP